MNPPVKTCKQWTEEAVDLRIRLAEANDTLRAIRGGEVDAVVVQGPQGNQLFTLKGADDPYRVLIEEMNQGAVTLSADGSILYCNHRFSDLLKTPLEKIVGHSFQAFVAPSERTEFAALLEAGRTRGAAGEITLSASDMSAVPLLLALGPLPAESAAAICLVATDVAERRRIEDERKQAEEALRGSEERFRALNAVLEERVATRTAELEVANKELEAFSYSVSHDLRAPLRAVDGFSHAVLEDYGGQLPEEGRHYLQTIRKGAQRMGLLIDDLLTFSRLSRLPLNKEAVNMTGLAHEALEELSGQRNGRQIDVRISDLPQCEGDPALLKQVWINLLSNAIKYTQKREAAVVDVGSREENGERVYFVCDNGSGFDMQYAPKLFGVFQRLHRADEFEGTGVGLAIVQRIVHRHGGRIWAQAALDRGAEFYFTVIG